MILYLSSRTTETEILSLADKVKKMLKCARKKSIEKKERDSLSFLSKLSTETLNVDQHIIICHFQKNK